MRCVAAARCLWCAVSVGWAHLADLYEGILVTYTWFSSRNLGSTAGELYGKNQGNNLNFFESDDSEQENKTVSS